VPANNGIDGQDSLFDSWRFYAFLTTTIDAVAASTEVTRSSRGTCRLSS
jgi:hypothetical protein